MSPDDVTGGNRVLASAPVGDVANRSTRPIEDGPVGYAIATLGDGVVSRWCKPLDDAFPFVVITAPVHPRLLRGPAMRRATPVRSVRSSSDTGQSEGSFAGQSVHGR